MARAKREFETPKEHEINGEFVARDMAIVNAREGELLTIDSTFGGDEIYDRTRIEGEVRFYSARSGEAFVEAGRRLIWLKEHEGHGGFGSCLARIGLPRRAAQRMMVVAAKFPSASALNHLGSSKLLEMAILDDEEIAALGDGGTIADYTVDDIEKMSVKELREALRKSEEANAEADEMVAKKNQKIDELDAQLSKPPKIVPWQEQANDAVGGCVSGFKTHTALCMTDLAALDEVVKLLEGCESKEQAKSLARTLMTEFNEFYAVIGAMFALVDERVAPLANQ
jgi:hypothetical protein